MYGKKYMGIERTTFLINKKTKIMNIWTKVKVNNHVEEVLEFTRSNLILKFLFLIKQHI